MTRITVLDNEYATVYLEDDPSGMPGVIFPHFYVHRWSPSIYKNFQAWWEGVCVGLRKEGWHSVVAAVKDGDDKHAKFVEAGGLHYWMTVTHPDGGIRHLYKRELNDGS
jgi:hypothetical protein